jgi:fructose-specific phosphotransferase system IIC component
MGHSHISYRGVTPAAVADTLRLLRVEVVLLSVVCVANKGLCLFGVLFLLPALGHYVQALTNADAAHIVCVCVCVCVCMRVCFK